MVDKTKLDLIGELTVEEMRLLNFLMQTPERSGFVNGENAGVIVSLQAKGLVKKLFRQGRVWKWAINPGFFGFDERRFFRERMTAVNVLGGFKNG